MIEYKLLPGVILVTVCDESMLVATGEARGRVPYTNGINAAGVYFWRMMEAGLDVDELLRRTAEECRVSPEDARAAFLRFARMLESAGYLTLKE